MFGTQVVLGNNRSMEDLVPQIGDLNFDDWLSSVQGRLIRWRSESRQQKAILHDHDARLQEMAIMARMAYDVRYQRRLPSRKVLEREVWDRVIRRKEFRVLVDRVFKLVASAIQKKATPSSLPATSAPVGSPFQVVARPGSVPSPAPSTVQEPLTAPAQPAPATPRLTPEGREILVHYMGELKPATTSPTK